MKDSLLTANIMGPINLFDSSLGDLLINLSDENSSFAGPLSLPSPQPLNPKT